MADTKPAPEFTDLPDDQVVAAALSRPEAFEHLVERYYPLIFSIARARLQNVETAEDLAQEVVLRLHLGLPGLRNTVAFPRWVRQITRNLASHWAESGQVRSRLLPLIPLEDVSAALEDVRSQDARTSAQRKQEQAMLELAIRRLPPSLQEVVLLHYAEGLSKSEVARLLGIHPSSVGRHLERALFLLREDLRPLLSDAAKPLSSKGRAAVPAAAFALAVAGIPAPARAAVQTALLQESLGSSAAGKASAATWLGGAGVLLGKGKIAALLVAAVITSVALLHLPRLAPPRSPAREFRGMWVPTVGNMDWPSKPGLTASQQQQELRELLDTAADLRLNAVVFQVRPCGDALYSSSMEPWSEFLTGQQGRSPGWDPLEYLVREGHARCLDVHAWINPFRAHHPGEKSAKASNHLTRLRPHLAKPYGRLLWLDPGEEEVQQHCLRVVEDILTRYDVDGIHYDDYFYPYPERDASGAVLSFPDDRSWGKYQSGGGRLSRDDWRRENISQFIRKTHQLIRKARPHVLFGVSPLGGWRPGFPSGSTAFDSYSLAYADSRTWWNKGWVDYLSPQIYWPTEHPTNGFGDMLKWWSEENQQERHLWPGVLLTQPGEALAQIESSRSTSGVGGTLLFSAKALVQNRDGLRDVLKNGSFSEAALVPASGWLDPVPPAAPEVQIQADPANGLPATVTWVAGDASEVKQWCIYRKLDSGWSCHIMPARQTSTSLHLPDGGFTGAVAITAVDRAGNESSRREIQTGK